MRLGFFDRLAKGGIVFRAAPGTLDFIIAAEPASKMVN
jgi:hypothetical protein